MARYKPKTIYESVEFVCTRKKRYIKKIAKIDASWLSQKLNDKVYYYKCKFCSRYHVGHIPKRAPGMQYKRNCGTIQMYSDLLKEENLPP